jgi:sugar-phosphatase
VPIAASPLTEPFRGVLLDLDGTLVDSIPAVERSWLRWCREYGVDPERLRGMHGVTAVNVIAEVLPEEQRDEAFRRIEAMEVADVDGIAVLPGALELLGALRDADVPTAIVTSSSAPLAEARLRATGLPNPDTVVTSSDVARGKPWPDPWLLGADRIGIDPSQCLVAPEELARVADLVVRDLAALEVEARSGLLRVLAGP